MGIEIRIGYLSTVYHTSLILIGASWLENRFGLKPSWCLFGGGPAIVRALSEDKLDLGYIGLPPVIIGIDKGAYIKCVVGGHMEGTVLIALPEFKSFDELGGDLRATLCQFEGKVIAVPPKGSIHDIIIRNLIEQLSLDNQIKVVNYEWADLIVIDMEKSKISVAVGTPALAVSAYQSVRAKVIMPSNRLWPNNPSYGIVVRSGVIEKESKLITLFIEAHRQATVFLKQSPDLAAQIVAKVIGLIDKEFVLRTFSISPKYIADLNTEFVKSTMDFIPVLHRLGYITHHFTDKDIFDFRYSERYAMRK
jgi:NitT/TauT family transport system substrate-binding protein